MVMYGCESWKESWELKNWCFWTVVLEKTLESPLDCKEIQPVHPKGDSVLGVNWKDWCWRWNSNTLATWYKQLTLWKRPWCWERLRAGGEGDDRGWDGWMASLTQWTWVWVNSGSWWWTGRPGMLRSMGLQRVGHHWVTELTERCDLAMSARPSPGCQGCFNSIWRELPQSQEESPYQKLNSVGPWPWTFSLQNCEKIHFCCLKHSVWAILLWQPKLI